MNCQIVSFRYVNKKGEGKSKAFYKYLGHPVLRDDGEGGMTYRPIKKSFRVRVIKEWKNGGGMSFYQAVPVDPFLADYLKKNAHKLNQELYFGQEAIA